MSSKLQDISSISPAVDNVKETEASDPVQVEFEEGKQFLEKNETGQAAAALHNALLGYEEREDQSGIANACNQLGIVCLARSENEKALVYFKRVYDICDSSNDRMSLLAVSKQCIIAYRGLQKYNEAVEKCLDILDWYQDNRDPQGAVATLELMAEIYIDAGSNTKAADAYRTAASIHQNFSHDTIAQKMLEKAEKLENDS